MSEVSAVSGTSGQFPKPTIADVNKAIVARAREVAKKEGGGPLTVAWSIRENPETKEKFLFAKVSGSNEGLRKAVELSLKDLKEKDLGTKFPTEKFLGEKSFSFTVG